MNLSHLLKAYIPRKDKMALRYFCVGILLATLFIANSVSVSVAHAATETITQTISDLYRDQMYNRKNTCGSGGYKAVSTPNISITYGADIIDEATGNNLTTSVEQGRSVILRFKPLVSSDIFWFGTGHVYDSPYGDWVAPGQKQTPPVCSNKDVVNFTCTPTSSGSCTVPSGTGVVYIPFLVNRPTLSMTQTDGLTCGALTLVGSTYETRCTVSGAVSSNVTAGFNFAQTTGRFYYRIYTAGGKFGFGSFGETHTNVCFYDAVMNDPELCKADGTPYVHTVPATSINIALTITPPPIPANAPSQPSVVSVTPTVCTLSDTEYRVRISATDPEGRPIRYKIDSNNDGSADISLPSDSSFVPSGTWQEFVISADKDASSHIVRMNTVNEDEGGVAEGEASGWKTETLTLDDSSVCGFTLSLSTFPLSLPLSGGSVDLSWLIGGNRTPNQCTASGDWSGNKLTAGGSETHAISSPSDFTLTCTRGSAAPVVQSVSVPLVCQPKPSNEWTRVSATQYNDGCNTNTCAFDSFVPVAPEPAVCRAPTSGEHFISVTPSPTRIGRTVRVAWEGPTACTVTGGTTYTWTSAPGVSGLEETGVIQNPITFKLECEGLTTKEATFRLAPGIEQF